MGIIECSVNVLAHKYTCLGQHRGYTSAHGSCYQNDSIKFQHFLVFVDHACQALPAAWCPMIMSEVFETGTSSAHSRRHTYWTALPGRTGHTTWRFLACSLQEVAHFKPPVSADNQLLPFPPPRPPPTLVDVGSSRAVCVLVWVLAAIPENSPPDSKSRAPDVHTLCGRS